MVPKILNIIPDGSKKRLVLKYSTGEIKIFDVTPYIRGDWFSQLADEEYFNKIAIYEDNYNIFWPNGQDLAPHELYEHSVLL